MCPLAFAILKISEKYDKVFNNSKILRARGTASVNCNCYEKLLYITGKQFVFVQRNAKMSQKQNKTKNPRHYKQNNQQFKTKSWLNSMLSVCIHLTRIYAFPTVSNLPLYTRNAKRHLSPVKNTVLQRTR